MSAGPDRERARVEEENILRAKDVARYLQINEHTVYRLVKEGKIPAVKIGKQWRFRLSEIEKLFRPGSPGSKEAPGSKEKEGEETGGITAADS